MVVEGRIEKVVEQSGSLVIKVPSNSDYVKKFEVRGNRYGNFQLKDLPGGEEKHFVKEFSAGKTYLKTTEGKYVVFDEEQNRVIEDSSPGLEVTGRCLFMEPFWNFSPEGTPD